MWTLHADSLLPHASFWEVELLERQWAPWALQGSPITQKEVEALMESIDVDATGSIDYDEFLAATINMSQLQVCLPPAGRPCLDPDSAFLPSQPQLLCGTECV